MLIVIKPNSYVNKNYSNMVKHNSYIIKHYSIIVKHDSCLCCITHKYAHKVNYINWNPNKANRQNVKYFLVNISKHKLISTIVQNNLSILMMKHSNN